MDGEKLYIGRCVTNSDIMVGRTWQLEPISLPYGCATNTQLVGNTSQPQVPVYSMEWQGVYTPVL